MTQSWRIVAIAAALIFGAGEVRAETPAERAERNLELLRSGAKKVSDLTEAEKRELVAAEQLAREGDAADRRTPRQRCVDEEVERVGGTPSELAMRVIDLKCSQR